MTEQLQGLPAQIWPRRPLCTQQPEAHKDLIRVLVDVKLCSFVYEQLSEHYTYASLSIQIYRLV